MRVGSLVQGTVSDISHRFLVCLCQRGGDGQLLASNNV